MNHSIQVTGKNIDDATIQFNEQRYKFVQIGQGGRGHYIGMEPDRERLFRGNPNLDLGELIVLAIGYLMRQAVIQANHPSKLETTVAGRDVTSVWDNGYKIHEPRKLET